MIENVSGNNENLVLDKSGVNAPQPPSSPETKSSESSQKSAEVDLQTRIAEKVGSDSREALEEDKSLEDELKESISSLNEKLSRLDRQVLFKLDKKIGKNYISVVDKESEEVIREFPPKEIRTFIARFDEINEQMMASSDIKSLIINLEV
ncbi:MAG: flagellar protein FlaG [bacterium]|nr:flagellar protein FlaG [bacterium]